MSCRNVFKAVHLTVVLFIVLRWTNETAYLTHLHIATNSAYQLAESNAFPAGGDVDRAVPVLPSRETQLVHATYHKTCRGFHIESLHPSDRIDQNTSSAMSSQSITFSGTNYLLLQFTSSFCLIVWHITVRSFSTINESTHTHTSKPNLVPLLAPLLLPASVAVKWSGSPLRAKMKQLKPNKRIQLYKFQ